MKGLARERVPGCGGRALLYQGDVMETLADLLDVCVNRCGCAGARVLDAFVVSGLAHEFERCNPAFVAGKSGVELAWLLGPYLGLDRVPLDGAFGRSPEYWLGWALGYFQVETGVPYEAVLEHLSYEELLGMYWPLHEAPESKFVEVVEGRLGALGGRTRLAQRRVALGLSQAEFALCSGVGLRSIQMYEQRNKDINKAQAATLLRLGRVLMCSMEDLVEP